jgi:hypothetical protein
MLNGIVLSILAAASVLETPDDKPFYIRSFENPSPTVDRYSISGTFGPDKTSFVLSLDYIKDKWHVGIKEGDKPARKLILNSAYKSIPINRVGIATDGSQHKLVVIIPFGDSHSNCFINGDDVYNNIVIEAGDKISLEHFPQCNPETVSLSTKKRGGSLEIAPPPNGR